MKRKSILFLTGTRADFGKLKPLMRAVEQASEFECRIFATGLHTLARYGYTVDEIRKVGFKNIHLYMNQIAGEPMDLVLANTVLGLARYVHEEPPDMIVVHGDRVEALAGAIVGSIRNILTSHVEGGEVSGTIDGLIRHSVSKMSHIHFVSNEDAAIRLRQLGEIPDSIFVVGSPDIDVMLSKDLPSLESVKDHYKISLNPYAIATFHPVTTEIETIADHARVFTDALIKSEQNFVVVFPNNDEGSEFIFDAYKKLKGNDRIQLFPSLRFEAFLTLLKHSQFIIGNSSAGIREAPVYGIPSIDVGSRQKGRFMHDSIINVPYDERALLAAIAAVSQRERSAPCFHFGSGNSAESFLQVLKRPEIWQMPRQKDFHDLIVPQLKDEGLLGVGLQQKESPKGYEGVKWQN